jgi:hypothetical protein
MSTGAIGACPRELSSECRGDRFVNPDTCKCECLRDGGQICYGQCVDVQNDYNNCGGCSQGCWSRGSPEAVTCRMGRCECRGLNAVGLLSGGDVVLRD